MFLCPEKPLSVVKFRLRKNKKVEKNAKRNARLFFTLRRIKRSTTMSFVLTRRKSAMNEISPNDFLCRNIDSNKQLGRKSFRAVIMCAEPQTRINRHIKTRVGNFRIFAMFKPREIIDHKRY